MGREPVRSGNDQQPATDQYQESDKHATNWHQRKGQQAAHPRALSMSLTALALNAFHASGGVTERDLPVGFGENELQFDVLVCNRENHLPQIPQPCK